MEEGLKLSIKHKKTKKEPTRERKKKKIIRIPRRTSTRDDRKDVRKRAKKRTTPTSYDDGAGTDDEVICCICLDALKVRAGIATVDGCRHRFHFHCILRWAVRNNVCPSCKAPFRTARRWQLGNTESANDKELSTRAGASTFKLPGSLTRDVDVASSSMSPFTRSDPSSASTTRRSSSRLKKLHDEKRGSLRQLARDRVERVAARAETSHSRALRLVEAAEAQNRRRRRKRQRTGAAPLATPSLPPPLPSLPSRVNGSELAFAARTELERVRQDNARLQRQIKALQALDKSP